MTDADWVKFLLGVIFTMLCSGGSYLLGARGKMSITACAKCQDACRKEKEADKKEMVGLMVQVQAKQAELSARQDELDDENGKKLDLVFRMLRATIMHLPIDADKKAEIINERTGK
jgi:hypothetical protein